VPERSLPNLDIPVRIGFLVNPKSGGCKGRDVLKWAESAGHDCYELPALLNPNSSLLVELRKHILSDSTRALIFIAGGDGTISWALNTCDRALLQTDNEGIANMEESDRAFLRKIYATKVLFQCIPLGTGNDISGILGSSNVYPGTSNIPKIVEEAKENKHYTFLDNWRIEHYDTEGNLTKWISNHLLAYFSIGGSSLVSAEFHQSREDNLDKKQRPWKNKVKYLKIGSKYLLGNEQKVGKFLDLTITDTRGNKETIEIPKSCTDLIFSNINSMAAGVPIWDRTKGFEKYESPSQGDGLLNVLSAKGTSAFSGAKIGISGFSMLGQLSNAELKILDFVIAQVDGEVIEMHQGVVNIKHHTTVRFTVQDGCRALSSQPSSLPRWLEDILENPLHQNFQDEKENFIKKISIRNDAMEIEMTESVADSDNKI